jgi:hypothetical protein
MCVLNLIFGSKKFAAGILLLSQNGALWNTSVGLDYGTVDLWSPISHIDFGW